METLQRMRSRDQKGYTKLLTFNDIHIRDPFILLEDDKYYLYGSRGPTVWGMADGFDVYVSDDLESWSEAIEVFHKPEGFWADRHYWAPEVHKYQGKFYMFASFKNETERRGTQILVATTPLGPFELHSAEPVTPRDWECLDGTLYIDKTSAPHMVFCREWLQVTDGEMWSVRLTDDLRSSVGEPRLLFRASEPLWARVDAENYVTDGPYLYRTEADDLLMIWSSSKETGYLVAIAYSDNGEIDGNWKHQEDLLFATDGGHGMIFTAKDGKRYLALHAPNNNPFERPSITEIIETGDTLRLL